MEPSRVRLHLAQEETALPPDDADILKLEDTSSILSQTTTTSVHCSPREDEPNLYNIPDTLYPTYRPLPTILKLFIAFASIFFSANLTLEKSSWLNPLLAVARHRANRRQMFSFFITALATGIGSNLLLQDIFLPPSRISTAGLFSKYTAPSKLSRFEPVALPGGEEIGVHYLKYQSKKATSKPPRMNACYVNHGFGASSLSWLPVLPSLVDRMGARVGLGHDMPGLGFTDRSKDIKNFSLETSAKIGSTLLSQEMKDKDDSVLLLGHSMGSVATLRMALALPRHVRKEVVLVAPALGMIFHSTAHRPVSVKKLADWSRPARSVFLRYSFDPLFCYVLRRLVGKRRFWRNSLSLFWGDASRLSNSDVLRYQWPSVGRGWEKGLLSFSRAQMKPPEDRLTDAELVEQVLALPNTSLTVIRGSKDKVIGDRIINPFWGPFRSKVKIIDLEGQGHDPFEEQVDVFLDTLDSVLEDSTKDQR